jgi:Concanavalin A-like lectin/glucanases superfamily/Fibronectin type III domain
MGRHSLAAAGRAHLALDAEGVPRKASNFSNPVFSGHFLVLASNFPMRRCLTAVLALLVLLAVCASAQATLLYPDLKTLSPRDLRFDRTDVSAESTGELHNVLRFSNTVYNAGEGPAEIRATIDQSLNPPSGQAYQRIYESTGGYQEVLLPGSTLYYHAVHKHYHFDHWGAYQLWTKAGWEKWIASGRIEGEPFLIGQKTTACVEDEEFVASVPAAVWPAAYPPANCLPNPENVIAEGLSPGWGDTYDYYRFEQWIDLGPTGSLANGTYVLRSVVDPNNIVYESPEKSSPSRDSQQANEATTTFKVEGGAIKPTELATGTVAINHVEKTTSSSQVSLEVLGRDTTDEVDKFRVSNDGSSWQTFENSSYDSVAQKVSWDLANATYGGSSASGVHTVYVQFHDSLGWGPSATDTIDYEPPLPPISAYGKAVNADGPVGWWRLGESSGSTAADQIGLDPGGYLGSVTLGQPSLIATDSNTAVAFDGKTAAVKVSASSTLSLTAPLTLEAWIKPSSLPVSGSFTSILTKPESYSLQFNGPKLEFTVIQSGTRRRLQAEAGAIVAGKTYYVVGTFDGTTQRLYVNGALLASAALSGTASVTTNPLYLASWDGAKEFFAGTVDEAAIYKKALSAAQVQAHYEAAVKVSLVAPSNLTAKAASSSRVDLSWTDNSSGESGEKLERSTSSSFGSATTVSLPAGTQSYSDSGLSAGTTYWYRVKAVSGEISSPYSNTAQASTEGAASYPSTIIADHPASYWRLDETSGTVAGDQTVANPGTYVGSPTLGAASLLAGEPSDGAVGFNGTTSTVRVGQAGTLDFTGALSLEAWIKPTSLPATGSFASIVTKPESYSLQLDGPQLELTVIESGFRMRVKAPAGAIVAGNAYYVAGTFDGTTQRLYINGAEVASAALSGTADVTSGGLYIGSWNGGQEYFSGTIDEPAIYAKALTAAQVAAHYSAAKPPLAAPTNLTAQAISASRIDLSWVNHASAAIGEVLQRSTSSSFSSPTEVALPAGTTSYSDTGLTAGTTYWYRVKAVNSAESSEWSQVASAKTSSSSAYANTVAADAPVSWWRLDESSGTTAVDQKGVNPGTYTAGTTLGMPSLISATQGDSAVAFDGTKGTVKVAQSSSLNLTNALTLEAWIKPTSLPASGSFRSILTKPESYSLQFNGPKLEMTIIYKGTRYRAQAPAGTIVAGSVYYVVGTFNGVTARLYVNAKQVGSVTAQGSASVTSSGLYIGSWNGSAEFFSGVIDEPAIYGKVLSAEAISHHYAAGTAP